ncbi:hypothetical protein [Thermococcus sp.]|uniref:hypothetical protein n=1 Tax=Thermococcus sp. TaxID=35749 RepID=UPI002612B2BE|nr:hypothetical protein [Thermococcus sp.]
MGKFLLLLSFFAGVFFLTALFSHALSISPEKSLPFAVILALLYTLAHVIRKDDKLRKSWLLKSRGLKYLIFFLGSFGFGVLLFGVMYLVFA